MIRKIIGAVSLFITFIVTFAIGVGCIVRGAGDFSWDIVSEYVSMSDIVMINDTPISNLFSFSDHSKTVGSHAEGQIPVPTSEGAIEIENMPAEMVMCLSEDDMIHFTFDGEVRESCVVSSVTNLTGKNIPNIEFDYNESTDKATIRFRNLRVNSKEPPTITIAIPAGFGGTVKFDDIAGKVQGDLPLTLTKLTVKDVAGKMTLNGLSAADLNVTDIAGSVQFDGSKCQSLTVKDCAGKVNVKGSVGTFKIDTVAGKVAIESDVALTDNCQINEIMGSIDITLPEGCAFKVKKDNVVGAVIAKNSKNGEYTVTITQVMGKVAIVNS